MSQFSFKEFSPADKAFDNLIKYAIAPRPIALVSSVNAAGEINLSPFSYFNLFSHNPPICVFSPLKRMRDGSTKHTYQNMQEVKEVVINIVDYGILHQQSLSSTEYAQGVNEFIKAGLTPIPSLNVTPPRVSESPVQLECKVINMVELGNEPGNGVLVVCEVVQMHFRDTLLNSENQLNQKDLDLVARLGGDWYCRVTEENLFEVPKPLRNLGIGVDQLPEMIRNSSVLTGNHLGHLANIEKVPSLEDLKNVEIEEEVLNYLINNQSNIQQVESYKHQVAARYLDDNQLEKAWKILIIN